MIGPRTLRGRLLGAQVIIVAVVVGAGMLTVRLLTPALFERGMRNQLGAPDGAGRGRGSATTNDILSTEIQDVYDNALTNAVVIASLTGLAAAVVLAAIISHVLLRRLGTIRNAAQRLAAGDYRHRIELPPETELAELAMSVNTLGATLDESEGARARLMSDVAHEIRNPLTTIEGYMEGLVDGVLPATAETFNEVGDEARRIKRIVEDLSFMSRAQEGVVSYEFEALDLAELCRQTVERLRPLANDAGIELVSSLEAELPALADRGRVTQALTNLVKNAFLHTPPGGTVTVAGRRTGRGGTESRCEITVVDTGDGIPAERLEIIFERFTRYRDGPGIGIGLNIARSIAEGHGGELSAASAGVGHGTTFTLVLPCRTS